MWMHQRDCGCFEHKPRITAEETALMLAVGVPAFFCAAIWVYAYGLPEITLPLWISVLF